MAHTGTGEENNPGKMESKGIEREEESECFRRKQPGGRTCWAGDIRLAPSVTPPEDESNPSRDQRRGNEKAVSSGSLEAVCGVEA